ncbi:hypothetical protein [Pleurocapsa sp. FMAR1]|uniref:hypothetical protein n=1 Tax=Pleurocapsa sp. FMAR1 TaxID=3040204 RepID=UPI0029C84EDE|nr:hypothetical protein [Pleurocapsa sp. FMAR1]
MKQSMQNLPNDLDPAKQTLEETLKQVEVNDRISSQSKSVGNSVKTPSLRPSQNVMNTNINAEPLSAQISKQITIVQVARPLSKAEAGNDKTILQNPKPQDSTPSVVLVDDVSLPQKPRVAQQSGSSSQPTQTFEAINRTQDPFAQFSLEDDSKNLNAAEATVVQNHNNTIVQHSDSVVQNLTERTIIQYSDSAIYNPAEQRVYQATPPLSTNLNQTLIQSRMPKSPHLSTLTTVPKNRAHIQLFHPSIRNMFRTLGSFWRKIALKQPQSLFHLGRQPAMGKILELPSSTPLNYSTHNAIASGEQPSLEQYQKKLRELDLCRLCLAKELARNGRFRGAIFEAKQISETSYFFKDAQMLIQSWK